jgi:hypothetical protein
MDIALSLNPELYVTDETNEGVIRPGLVVSETFGGEPQSRDYSEGNRRVYEILLEEFPPQDGTSPLRLAQFEAFLEQIQLGNLPFRVNIPVSRRYTGFVYPKGDASRVFFDLPGTFLEAQGMMLMESGVYVPESDYTYHGPANIIPNRFASLEEAVDPTDRGYTAFGSCSLKWRTGFAAWGIGCILVDTTGSAGNVGFICGEDSAYGEIAVTADAAHTAGFAFRGVGEFRVKTRYYLSDRTTTTGSLTTGSAETGSETVWLMATVDSTAPADAAFVRITCERVTSSSNKWLGDCVTMAPQGYPLWHYTACAPDVIEMDSAPANNARLKISGNLTEHRPRLKITGKQIRWSLLEEGTAMTESFQAQEVID